MAKKDEKKSKGKKDGPKKPLKVLPPASFFSFFDAGSPTQSARLS